MVAAEVAIWRSWKDQCYDLSLMTSEVRRVLGVLKSCDTDQRTIAEWLNMRPQRVVRVLAAVRKCQHPLVVHAWKNGLPISAAADVSPDLKVMCKVCRAHLIMVPCIRCGLESGESPGYLPADKDYLPDEHPYSTQAYPGSRDKIDEMRFRAALGHRVFHQEDLGSINDYYGE